jgi:hypothetical protein
MFYVRLGERQENTTRRTLSKPLSTGKREKKNKKSEEK